MSPSVTVRTIEVDRPPFFLAYCEDCGWQSALVDSELVAAQLTDIHLDWHEADA